jgi:hypothetical protein
LSLLSVVMPVSKGVMKNQADVRACGNTVL